MTVAQTAQTYRPEGKFRPWLMRIVRNRCLNKLRSDHVRRVILSQGQPNIIPAVGHNPSPCEVAEDNEQTATIRATIGKLPDRQREAITLYAFEQMSYRVISEVLDTPINTVKTLIFRARASLAQALDVHQEENEREL